MGILKMLGIQLITRPIFNLLIVFLAIFGGNLGIAIILLTLVIRFAMLNITSTSNQMQSNVGNLQPKLNEIQEKYKDDPKKLSEEMMKILKKDGKGPLKGFLMMFIQIPVFFGLFYTIRKLSEGTISEEWLYSFFYSFGSKYASVSTIDNGNVNHIFLGIDLMSNNNIILTIFSVLLTYLQMKLTNFVKPQVPKTTGTNNMPDMSKMMGMMTIFMVFMIGTLVYKTQSAIGLYLVVTTLFSVVQYTIQYRKLIKVKRLEFRKKPQIISK